MQIEEVCCKNNFPFLFTCKNLNKFLNQNLYINSSCNFSLPSLCASEAKAVAHNSHIADLYQEAV